MGEKGGGEFLNIKYPGLKESPGVKSAVQRNEIKNSEKTPNNPTDKIDVFLERLENIFENPDENKRTRAMEIFKNSFLYPEVLIDPDNVPDSYFELQLKIARERGQSGDLVGIDSVKDIPQETRRKTGEALYKDQKKSLDTWIDYLSSSDASYPTWFKYYTLRSVLKMSNYDKENHNFKARFEDTVGVFPELNRAALAKVNDILINKYGTEYFQLREEIESTKNKLKIMDNYKHRLAIVLTGKNENKKEVHIKKKDLENIKQSLESDNLVDLEEEIIDLLDKQKQYLQLRNIPDKFTGIPEEEDFGKIYAYAIHEMTPASKENKGKTEGEWSKFNQGDDPTALYESLQGHGLEWCTAGGKETAKSQLEKGDFYVYYSKDEKGKNTIPRIAIRMENNQVVEVRGIEKNQNMETSMTDIAKEKYHQLPGGEKFDKKDGDMKRLTLIDKKVNNKQELSKEELKFLYEIDNSIEGFGYQKDPRIEDIISKRSIKSDLSFVFDCKPEKISITEEEALKGDIKFHYGDLDLAGLTSVEGLILPNIISGDLHLNSLTSAEGLVLPNAIKGSLILLRLTSAEGLILPDTIGHNLDLSSLTSAKGLILPGTINGNLKLSSLTSAEGLVLPGTIGYDLDLSRLTSAKGLILPGTIGHNLELSSLTSAEGLILPDTIGHNLDLYSLTSAKGLILPGTIGYNLNLSSLTSAKGLVLPNTINGSLYLHSLTKAKGLVLPDIIKGSLYLSSLTSSEKQLLIKKYSKLNII